MYATRLILIVALTALWLYAGAGQVSACSCAGFTPAEAFERADSVFVGEVMSSEVKRGFFGQSSIDPVTVEFTVNEVWKGPRQQTITVGTVRSEVSCGFEFVEGLEYLVYARDDQTGLCDRTALAVRASEDLAALGEGWRPAPAPPEESPAVSGSACNAPADAGRNRADLAALFSLAGLAALNAWRKRGL